VCDSGSVIPGARFDPYRPPVPDDDPTRRQNPGYKATVFVSLVLS